MKTDILWGEPFDFKITINRQSRFEWSEWIAVILSCQSRSALDSTFAYKLTFRISWAVYISAIGRIGVNNESHSSVLFSVFGLIAAKISAIAGNYNFPFY